MRNMYNIGDSLIMAAEPCWFVWSAMCAITWNNLENIRESDYNDSIHRCRRHGASIGVPSVFWDVCVRGLISICCFPKHCLDMWHLMCSSSASSVGETNVSFGVLPWELNSLVCLMAVTLSKSAIMFCLWSQDVYATLRKVMKVLKYDLCWTRKYLVTQWPHF